MTLTAAPPLLASEVDATSEVDAAVLADLCQVADLQREVINTVTEPAGGAYVRPAGIWIDASSTKELTVAVAVLAEAIGQGAAAAIRGLVIHRHGGGCGAEPGLEAHLPGWTIA